MDSVDVIVKETSGAFITTWGTTTAGESITIPVHTATGRYDVIWGDGTISENVRGDQTHPYATSGNHTVTISGGFEMLRLDGFSRANASKLMSVDQWGAIRWTSMESAFYRASNMEYRAADSPDLSRVRTMLHMFEDATKFNGDISSWNVSSVTDMGQMFALASVFNQNLNNWNVSSVTNMNEMFYFARAFNQDLNNWNTSRVTDMSSMFFGASAFNGTISDWNTSRVTDMSSMFSGASNFNGDISSWDVSSVTNMVTMFNGATSFDQNLGEWYVVANATSIARADVPGVVAEISAQNSHLDGHAPTYGIGKSVDSALFEIVGGNQLNMTSADAKSSYTVNVTASGPSVFESGNNWKTVTITVTDTVPPVPVLTTDAALPTDADSITVLVDFGEAINATTFTVSDVLVTGGTASNLAHQSGNRTFAFTLTPAAYGEVTASIPAGRVADLAGNTNTVSNTLQITFEASGPKPFITTWKTASGGETITIPLIGTGITVDWGDGNTTTVSGDATHTYADAGDHTVSVSGGLKRINLNDAGVASKLVSIDQWGDTQWTSMANAFRGADNMVYKATDAPDLSGVQYMSNMFRAAGSFNGDLSSWNVSSVTRMDHMFLSATVFDKPLNSWDVSQVTTMVNMFYFASAFNQDLNSWDVSQVTTMARLFSGASSFDKPLSSWNVSQVTTMARMFSNANSFNQNLSSWNVSSVADMTGMFRYASTFNQNLSSWDVSSANHMAGMFFNANSFRQNLGNWYVTLDDTTMPGDLSAAPAVSPLNTYLEGRSPVYSVNDTRFVMDGKTLRFNMTNLPTGGEYPLAITTAAKLDEVNNPHHTRDVTITVRGDPDRPFVTTWETDAANQEITIPVGSSPASYYIDWGDGTIESAVTGDQTHTYAGAGNHTIYISGGFERIHLNDHTNASKLRSIDQWGDTQWTSMKSAFNGTGNMMMMMMYKATDVPDLSGVQDMSGMFEDSSFNGNISGWNVSQVTDMSGMFFGAASFDQHLNDWNVSQVTDMSNMFRHAASFDQHLNDWNVSQVTDMGGMFFDALTFNGNVSSWNVSQVTDMSYMFFDASAFKGDISGWNVSQVTSMLHMFLGASDFNGDISGWNVLQVTDMLKMFSGATSFNLPLNDWDVSSVTIMSSMFSGATSFNQTLNDWNVSSVIHMDNMFHNATSFDRPLNDWNVSSVTTMNSMFSDASNFNGNISGWNVSQVTHMSRMFSDASAFNQDLDSWNTLRVLDMSGMFAGASNFSGNISGWNVSSVTNMNGMFTGASNFNGDISGWNVSSVLGMSNMFDGAISFLQNLGEWYIVPADTAYDATANTLNVTTISAQNSALKGHTPNYEIGISSNSTLFNMTGSTLMFKATPSAGGYTVNVTALGGDFGIGNHRILDVTVTGSTNTPPTVSAGSNLTVAEGSTLALSGSATDTDGDNTITSYTWVCPMPGSRITFANASFGLYHHVHGAC